MPNVTEEDIEKLLRSMSPEDRMAFDAMNNEGRLPVIEPIGEIPLGIPDGMSQEAVDAMNYEGTPPVMEPMPGMSPQAGGQIGASPEVSGINAEEENKRRMMEQLLRNQYGR
jgi:hypothetical protein